jgi:hypothetical protein
MVSWAARAADFARVLEEAARITGDECFGLHFGQHYHPKNIGPLAYVVLNSPTMGVGFENVARYLRVHNEAAEVAFRWGRDGRTCGTCSVACPSRAAGSTTSSAWRWDSA